jgi:hypothetical protein
MSDIPTLPVAQLKLVVTDPQELAKGVAIADKGGIKHLARHANKLFAEAEGSGSSPYKTQIVHDEKGYRGRCSCMAARSRPFCKHAAALLVAWARDPSAFAVSELAPEATAEPGVATKRTKAKSGKVDTDALMRQGVEQTMTLVRELALSGIATINEDRVTQIRTLAETLRAERLRRMSARMLELSGLLSIAAKDYGMLDTEEYSVAITDLWLSARRVQKHLDGDVLKLEHVETLIGRSWTKKDRAPISGLDLLEYAFLHQITADDFVIRESRFIDLASGLHYSEKQILPAFLAKRTTPKRTYEGFVVAGAEGGRYPGFAPFRLDLSEQLTVRELDQNVFPRLIEKSLPGVGPALAALIEHHKDVFAPETLPASIQIGSLHAQGDRLFAMDASGESLMIAGGAEEEIAITSALAEANLRLLIGDLLFLGAIPCLHPLALITERGGVFELVSLPAANAEALMATRRRNKAGSPKREHWIDTARALGMSSAAVTLGEVREELAEVLSEGLNSLTPRRVEGQVERLNALNLVKPAALLAEVANRNDPAERLDDIIRLLQVLGIGLTRLAASRKVDRASLVRSPLHPAIETSVPDFQLTPETLVKELNSNRLRGHTRAVAIDRALGAFDNTTLSKLAPALFGDGSVSSIVGARYAGHSELALEIARDILLPEAQPRRYTMRGVSAFARVAKFTAIQLLKKMATPASRELLHEFLRKGQMDPTLKALVTDALHPASRREVPKAIVEGLTAGNREDRSAALQRIVQSGVPSTLQQVRRLAATDPSQEVRHRAWYAQAALLDVDAVPLWIAALERRADNDDSAREAIHALGHIGDNRGIAPLLDAFVQGFKPTLLAEALQSFGPPILPALLDRVDALPELAERKAAQSAVATLDPAGVREAIAARLKETEVGALAERAQSYLKLVSANKQLKAEVAADVEAMISTAESGSKAFAELRRALARVKQAK